MTEDEWNEFLNTQDSWDDFALTLFEKWEQSLVPGEGWEFVTEQLPRVSIFNAGGFCPFQAEGRVGDLNFYFRERSDHATLKLFAPGTDFLHAPAIAYEASYPEDVSVSKENFVEVFEALYEASVRYIPLWTVEGFSVDAEGKREDVSSFGRGWSAQEAREYAQAFEDEQKTYPLEYWVTYFGTYSDEAFRQERAKSFYKYVQGKNTVFETATLNEKSPLDSFLAIPDFDVVKTQLRR